MAVTGVQRFSGKVAFVAGGASGIGRATALAFARDGASVAIADTSKDGAQQSVHAIEDLGARAIAIQCDVSQAEDVRSTLNQTIKAFGRLDCAFNNAGIEEKIGSTATLSEEVWDRVIAVNLKGVFLHDGPVQRRNPSRSTTNDRLGANGKNGQARGSRRSRPMAPLGRGLVSNRRCDVR